MVVVISTDDKVECLHFEDGAINKENFEKFLRKFHRKFGGGPIYILMDNLKVHKGKEIMPVYDELDIQPIWNVVASLDFNQIEVCLAQVKLVYKQIRLKRAIFGFQTYPS